MEMHLSAIGTIKALLRSMANGAYSSHRRAIAFFIFTTEQLVRVKFSRDATPSESGHPPDRSLPNLDTKHGPVADETSMSERLENKPELPLLQLNL